MSSRSMKVSFLYKIIKQKPYLETRVAFKTRLNINLFCTERTEGRGGSFLMFHSLVITEINLVMIKKQTTRYILCKTVIKNIN